VVVHLTAVQFHTHPLHKTFFIIIWSTILFIDLSDSSGLWMARRKIEQKGQYLTKLTPSKYKQRRKIHFGAFAKKGKAKATQRE
jgi:hypothetical protein